MAPEGSRLAVIAAFLANLAIAVAKFVAAALTGSAAMLSESYHSLADTGNQGMLLFGMRQARKPADADHPFGRGKESYFWSFMVAVMLFAGGAVLAVRHGLDALADSHDVENLTPSFVVLGASILIEAVSFTVAFRQFNKTRGGRSMWRAIRSGKDSSIIVVLLEDTAALAGLVVALVGITLVALTDRTVFDGVASLVIGVILGLVAWLLAVETKGLLIGEAANRADRVAIRSRLLAMPEVESVGKLLTMQMGPHDVLVNVEVDLVDGMTDAVVGATIDRAEKEIQAVLPGATNIFVEFRGSQRS
jgi:cation diffusion facilitator family transporter